MTFTRGEHTHHASEKPARGLDKFDLSIALKFSDPHTRKPDPMLLFCNSAVTLID
jgi:hypothetical protein